MCKIVNRTLFHPRNFFVTLFQNEVALDNLGYQSRNEPQQSDAQVTVISNCARSLNAEATRSPEVTDPSRQDQVNVYAILAPQTRSWEVPRESLTIKKIIGKGAFGQVAKATATGLQGTPGETIVAVKMLQGERKHLI